MANGPQKTSGQLSLLNDADSPVYEINGHAVSSGVSSVQDDNIDLAILLKCVGDATTRGQFLAIDRHMFFIGRDCQSCAQSRRKFIGWSVILAPLLYYAVAPGHGSPSNTSRDSVRGGDTGITLRSRRCPR